MQERGNRIPKEYKYRHQVTMETFAWQATRNQNKLNYSITSWRRTLACVVFVLCILKLKWILNAEDDCTTTAATMSMRREEIAAAPPIRVTHSNWITELLSVEYSMLNEFPSFFCLNFSCSCLLYIRWWIDISSNFTMMWHALSIGFFGFSGLCTRNDVCDCFMFV